MFIQIPFVSIKINSCWIEISFSSHPESLQILANEIGNSAIFRSDDVIKKSLKILKEQSESSYWRRTDNTMANKKKVQKDKQRSSKHYN